MAHKEISEPTKIPPFESTPLASIPASVSATKATFKSGKTKNVEYRLIQLRKLYWGLKDRTGQLREALKHDLNRPPHDAHVSDIDWSISDCMFAIQNLTTWVQDDKNIDVFLPFSLLRPRIRKEPLGMVLIIGTYNFPVQLNICPLIGAIAAGCTAVVKPSENAPATAMVLKGIIEDYLDTDSYRVVNGAVPETTALLDQKWDKILYTGGVNVAKIISKKASETLTPVCLELGGKNPAFVTSNADLRLAARRLLWGKTLNAGQVCVSHNYVLIERGLVKDFVKFLRESYSEFFPKGAKESPDFCRIINAQHFDRMKNMLDSTRGQKVLGGDTDRNDLYIEPTAVLVDDFHDIMIQEESFGPIWAILPYDDLEDAITVANETDSTPLALMTFGSPSENEKVLSSVTSGGATLNDAFMHAAVHTFPFGGVGYSGSGSYRGKASFDCFTHRRTIAETPNCVDKIFRVRYMPYLESELRMSQWLSDVKPDFDRHGRQVLGLRSWAWKMFRLGSASGRGILLRWIIVAASCFAAVNVAGLGPKVVMPKVSIEWD
ncbi:Beta-apo-4'-carotenal oxygenase [Colletotrichum siamense]|uniref:Beta-apo-4'-carotenal oxygenase n=1 Tax=Colletotrichum siamense TaxID=690259 RepID=UPI0018726CF2|nr:Beta-apo-4'-carotenal oxygenase [Colletotrichum siamense]KAF5494393.1 Beta-apo-4'-carotenal oxygenase [Colletotrichum siamense]